MNIDIRVAKGNKPPWCNVLRYA